MKQPPIGNLLTIEQAAQRASVSVHAIRKAIQRGRLVTRYRVVRFVARSEVNRLWPQS